jgi:hypothetical protein
VPQDSQGNPVNVGDVVLGPNNPGGQIIGLVETVNEAEGGRVGVLPMVRVVQGPPRIIVPLGFACSAWPFVAGDVTIVRPATDGARQALRAVGKWAIKRHVARVARGGKGCKPIEPPEPPPGASDDWILCYIDEYLLYLDDLQNCEENDPGNPDCCMMAETNLKARLEACDFKHGSADRK